MDENVWMTLVERAMYCGKRNEQRQRLVENAQRPDTNNTP
jgi:hypothetical protein